MNLLEKYIGNTTFSETKIPLKIIATDIDTGEKYIFETGKIIDAIRASISIPGVFRPYNHLGKHFVDG
jgi:NTE family protein